MDRGHQIGCPRLHDVEATCSCEGTPLFDLVAKADGLWLLLHGKRYRAAILIDDQARGPIIAGAIREVYDALRPPQP